MQEHLIYTIFGVQSSNPGSRLMLLVIGLTRWSGEIESIPCPPVIHSFPKIEFVSSDLHLYVLWPSHVSFPNYHSQCWSSQDIMISQWRSKGRQPRSLCFMVSRRVLYKNAKILRVCRPNRIRRDLSRQNA
jgi:hypothetical protein